MCLLLVRHGQGRVGAVMAGEHMVAAPDGVQAQRAVID